jgi:hypothetical protein
MKVSITLNDLSSDEATALLNFVHSRRFGVIDPLDNPETGADPKRTVGAPAELAAPYVPPIAPPQGNPFGFGNAPLPPEAVPVSAVVAPLPTVPAISIPAPVPTAPAVPSAPVAVVPSVPAVPASPASAVTLDSKGLPWDHRIHTSTKSTNKDGSWRQLRGSDPAVVAAVEAELRGALGRSVPAAPVAAPSGNLTGVAATDFAAIMGRLMSLVASNRATQAGVLTLLQKHGIESFAHLPLQPAAYPALDLEITALEA